MLGLANFPVDSMPNVYAPTPTNAATPALNNPVGGTDSTDDHCGENVEEDEESEQREDVHDNREEDAGHCGEGPGDDPRPEDHVPSVDARGPCEDQVVRAGPHRLPERGEF